MQEEQLAQEQSPVSDFLQGVSDYLPALAAGLLVFALGIGVGWLVKRAVIRVLMWLRLDRLGAKLGWRAAFGKGDVRAALYDVVGNVAMVLIVLVFLDNALEIWGLTVLSRALAGLVFLLPNLAVVAIIVGLGLFLSGYLADRARRALEDEEFAHARLVGKMLKGILLSVVVALALWQLGFARQLVLAGFLIAFGAIGVAFAMAVGLGSAKAIHQGLQELFDKRKGKTQEEGREPEPPPGG